MQYTHKLHKPFQWGEKEFEELVFDWDKLTGRDTRDIERILNDRLGHKPSFAPETSPEFLTLAAARACTVPIEEKMMLALPMCEFNKITRELRYFLLTSVSLEETVAANMAKALEGQNQPEANGSDSNA